MFHRILLPLREKLSFQLSPWFRKGLRRQEKVLWKFLPENHNSRKHKVLFLWQLTSLLFCIKTMCMCALPVEIATKADQYVSILAKLLCWFISWRVTCLLLLFIKILLMMMEREIIHFQKKTGKHSPEKYPFELNGGLVFFNLRTLYLAHEWSQKLGDGKEQSLNAGNQKKVYMYKMSLYCRIWVKNHLSEKAIDSDICEVGISK